MTTNRKPDLLRNYVLLLLATCNLQPAFGVTVVGDLKDISIQALNTSLMFAPTNEVLVTPGGLSAGPPKVIESVNGQFSILLDASVPQNGDQRFSVEEARPHPYQD